MPSELSDCRWLRDCRVLMDQQWTRDSIWTRTIRRQEIHHLLSGYH